MATVSFTNTKIRNYFETPGELAHYQDSNEYFRSPVYGVAVLILEKVRRYPGEEAVAYRHQLRAVGEHTFPDEPVVREVIIWFIYLHNKKSPGGLFFPGTFLICIFIERHNQDANGE